MKKTKKIKFVGYWPGMDPETEFIYQVLSKHYHTVICDEPDYIICSCFRPFYEYCKYPQVRIMDVGENYIPDFNLVDYAICRYPLSMQDRCFYKPGCCDPFEPALALEKKERRFDDSILVNKSYFANFIASHESEAGIRGQFFLELCKYKRVESPGTYLNNMLDARSVSRMNSSKSDFQKKCKFTLCFESTKHEGFITEKITDAFNANTIPVYYGSDSVKDIFNPKAFINVSDYDSWEHVIDYIKLLDNNDDLYLEMMNQPILNDPHYFSKLQASLEEYILHIFEQPIETAYRRSKVYSPKYHESYLIHCDKSRIEQYTTKQLFRVIANRAKVKVKKCIKR